MCETRKKICRLGRAEWHAKKPKEATKAKMAFTENPFYFVKRLLMKKTSDALNVEQEELENHHERTYSDANRRSEVKQLPGLNSPPSRCGV